ncbi:hypothetical protein IMZ31_22900 (plasmid) [Pontibacillus sp. ALD_SL1]|uniref:YrhC-like protein n=1 Tax=Pontibacillus salipaludis TaxID=1697394 RepID=A0ABQ1Q601_9BACI|nr:MULTISPECIES: hypothetical protein [Pontibacillus]QSS99344.1 hypothetical protein IMZ31_14835 [Pontibacillus sp. ALD_SL1]QST02304.1 hypothetical protein IMZ31_22900 [Pontibacillus sp. ALD_SL1]GGD13456.1 hypothetical protein GCM10011389_21350 [Pontibacillus salipaludis]
MKKDEKITESNEGYRRFKLVFHSIILIFALCLIASSFLGFDDMERAPLYLSIGILFSIQSLFGLHKSGKQKLEH